MAGVQLVWNPVFVFSAVTESTAEALAP